MAITENPLCLLFNAAFRRYSLMIGMNIIPLSSLRIYLLRLTGVRVGTGCYIGFNVMPDTNYPELISIGDNVTISHNCVIIAHTQTPARSRLSTLYQHKNPVHIGNGSWIGMNSIILPGAVISDHCFIGAGSVVTSNMPTMYLCAGNPCKPVKPLSL